MPPDRPTQQSPTDGSTACDKTPGASTPSSSAPSTVQRLPAWGVHNQTTVVLLAAVADNAWARQVWYDEARNQARHPPER